MTSPMVDLDEFKAAWQRLDARLAAQQALAFQAFRDRRVHTLRRRLWPLYGGQVVQMAFGIAMLVFGIYGWRRNMATPHLVAAGVLAIIAGMISSAELFAVVAGVGAGAAGFVAGSLRGRW